MRIDNTQKKIRKMFDMQETVTLSMEEREGIGGGGEVQSVLE